MPPRSMASPWQPDLALGDEELRQRAYWNCAPGGTTPRGLDMTTRIARWRDQRSGSLTKRHRALLEREIVLPLPATCLPATLRSTQGQVRHRRKGPLAPSCSPSLSAWMSSPCAIARNMRCSMCAATRTPRTTDSRSRRASCQLPERCQRRRSRLAGGQDCAPNSPADIRSQRGRRAAAPVHSRFGLHVVEVLERMPGIRPEFEAVKGAVMMSLQQNAYVTALRQVHSGTCR